MGLPSLKTLGGLDQNLSLVQSNVKEEFDALQNVKLLQGQLIGPFNFTTGADNVINHPLGRTPVGWFVVSPSAAGSVYTSSTLNSSQSTKLLLRASAALTASLWIF